MGKLFGNVDKSKVAKKILSDHTGKGMLNASGSSHPGFKSGTKHTTNPTEGMDAHMGDMMGHPSLSGAHGNKAKRSLAK